MKTFEIGTDADVLTVSEEQLNEVVRQGIEAVRQARGAGEVPPDALKGKPAAMLVALAGFGDLMTGLQWRHLGGIVARVLATKTPAGFTAYRRWVTACASALESTTSGQPARQDVPLRAVEE